MADIESILWEMFDEDRGQFGASGSPTYIAEVLTEKLLSDEAVEQAADILEALDGDDYLTVARAALTAALGEDEGNE